MAKAAEANKSWSPFFSKQPKDIARVRTGRIIKNKNVSELFVSSEYEDFREMPDYATFSANVYEAADAPVNASFSAEECGKAGTRMPLPFGWQPYADPPELLKDPPFRVKISGLKYQVWENPAEKKVLLVFRGTAVFWDWYANARWLTRFIPFILDHYDQVRRLVPVYVQHIRQRYGKDVEIIAAGHSLGGGLAQQAAYACSYIKKVYAFDSSPVTGYHSVNSKQRRVNRQSIRIYRLFEHGEILAFMRFALQRFYKTSVSNPKIVEVRFNFGKGNSIKEHSMRDFACNLNNANIAARQAQDGV